MVQCNSCGGRYEPIQRDGTQYFHRCPPLSAPELQAAVDAKTVTLPNGETADDAIAARIYERADFRDENLPSTAAKHAGQVKAIGLGVTDVVDVAPPAVVVVPASHGA